MEFVDPAPCLEGIFPLTTLSLGKGVSLGEIREQNTPVTLGTCTRRVCVHTHSRYVSEVTYMYAHETPKDEST